MKKGNKPAGKSINEQMKEIQDKMIKASENMAEANMIIARTQEKLIAILKQQLQQKAAIDKCMKGIIQPYCRSLITPLPVREEKKPYVNPRFVREALAHNPN